MNNIAKFSGELMAMCNKYIDHHKMTTEEVCGVLDVVSFRVKESSKLQDVLEDNPDALKDNLS